MLESLHISNYALIDSMDIRFHSGFNIITGETGAGKSIILGALGLLLGGRADLRTIRNKDSKSVIEAGFNVTGNEALRKWCQGHDLEWDDTQMIMRRELSPSGRSRSFINDSPVTLAIMQEAGSRLIDIHSQHQNQMLAGSDFQLRIIDAVADNAELLQNYRVLYDEFRNSMRRFKTTKAAIQRDRDNADFMEFQLSQLDELDLKEGELTALEEERDTIASQTEIKSHINEALDALCEGNGNILSQLSRLRDSCAEIDSFFSDDDRIDARLEAVRVELSDIADTLSDIDSKNGSVSESDLEEIDTRISEIHSQMRRHNADTEADLIDVRNDLRRRLGDLEDAENVLAALEAEARRCHRKALDAAREISGRRTDAARKFEALLLDTAIPLGMKNLRCVIDVAQSDMSATGIDKVDFRFAFNKNQELTSIGGSASGGEISRLMLSVKSIVAEMFSLPTVIFDEVDTGVSGDVASRMGRMMSRMASNLQVITITHLPQVASRGAHHYKVFKQDDELSTRTGIVELTPDGRLDELALMLSGDPADKAARANAEALLAVARKENESNATTES